MAPATFTVAGFAAIFFVDAFVASFYSYGTSGIQSTSSTSGFWNGVGSGFLPVKIYGDNLGGVSANVYYGWISLKIDPQVQNYEINQLAYESTPGESFHLSLQSESVPEPTTLAYLALGTLMVAGGASTRKGKKNSK